MNAQEYADYLRSPHWRAMREWALERADHRCEHCGNPADDVHHLTYDRVGGELPDDLVALCRRCHDYAHESPSRPDDGHGYAGSVGIGTSQKA